MAKKKQEITAIENISTQERIDTLRAKYGKQHLYTFGDNSKINKDTKFISSGSLYFDLALGGGFPKCTIAELFSKAPSAGKTTTCLHLIKNAQEKYPDEDTAFIDVEHRLDRNYAINGVGIDQNGRSVIIEQPNSAEEALNIIEDLIRMGGMSVIVVDSIAGLVTENEIKKDTGEMGVAEVARLMSQALKKLKNIVRDHETLLLFTNQSRIIQVAPFQLMGTPGGNAMKFFSSIRAEIKKDVVIKDGDTPIGQTVHAKVEKNSFASPYREADFYIMFGKGISKHDEIFDIALEMGEIEKSGSWFSMQGTQLGQGKINALKNLRENKELFIELEKKAKEFVFGR